MKHAWMLAPLLAGAIGFGQGCVGVIGDAGDVDALPAGVQTCDGKVTPVVPVPLRRLSRVQYRNTLRDLLGDSELDFELEDEPGPITERAVRQLRSAVELALTRQAQWSQQVFPCSLDGEGSSSCVQSFINDFGERAFRRPLSDADRSWLQGVFDKVRPDASFRESMEVLLQVMLQASAAVYMFEQGGDEVSPGMHVLTDYEVASRLSYFLWQKLTDEQLMAAAKSGQLASPEGLRKEAERLLADPRAEQTIQQFFSGWLQLDGGRLHHALEDTTKDPDLYPEYDAALQTAMRVELEAFVHRTYFDEDASFDKLLTGNYAYLNGPLAEVYGVEGVSGDDYRWVDLEDSERGGLLGRAAFLTVFSTRNVTAPIRRGVWVMENALCNELGEPPPNVDDTPIEGSGAEGEELTVREDVMVRTQEKECQTCHSFINPLGFSFESYDAIGRYQSVEVTSGLPVDSSGEIKGSDIDGEVDGLRELSEQLASSEQVKACFASRWAGAAFGEEKGHLDSCSESHIESRFAETGDMKDLLLSITLSNAFRFINTSEDAQ